jgi:tetratricopeptide (TPR) repeat protein
MLAPILGTLLTLQQAPCAPAAMRLLSEAYVHASRFEFREAVESLGEAPDCNDTRVAAVYVQGLLDARAAASVGGTTESLAPVRAAIAVLEQIGRNRPGPPEIARLVLHAAAAAAQAERDEMRLYLESASRMEGVQEAAGQPGAPIVSATEMAGALWLQVDRYDEARLAYEEAERRLGPVPRISLGVARASARLGDAASACAGYRRLVEAWGAGDAEQPEIIEGRAYLARPECRPVAAP